MAHFHVYEPIYISDFDRLFDDAYNARTGGGSGEEQKPKQQVPRTLRPRMDVHEDDKSNLVTAFFELPGVKKEDISIDVHNNILTVSGESKLPAERDENGYVVRERRFGKFSRSIPVPQGTKAEEVKASLDQGVLTVMFPKTTPEQAPKKITIS
ncbi:HSP20-like chaperone [Panus rudis PR-1116 ss-1]|nr:HSP20-like chaperone [Panus rudis PR-1116 ss-1]